MSRIATALLFALAPLVAACGTASEAAPAPAPAKPAATSGDFQTACMTVMQRNRTCTDDFIPALVDMRARKDMPAGIAEAVAKDRAAVIVRAKEEWVNDSKDEVFARQCQALGEHATPENIAAGEACMAKDTCGEYAPCIVSVMETSFHK
jgi:hypothetical protein